MENNSDLVENIYSCIDKIEFKILYFEHFRPRKTTPCPTIIVTENICQGTKIKKKITQKSLFHPDDIKKFIDFYIEKYNYQIDIAHINDDFWFDFLINEHYILPK